MPVEPTHIHRPDGYVFAYRHMGIFAYERMSFFAIIFLLICALEVDKKQRLQIFASVVFC